MFPHVHQGVSLEDVTYPVVRAQVMMGGDEVRSVVDRNGILPKPPWRLNTDEDVAKPQPGNGNRPVVAVHSPGGLTPRLAQLGAYGCRPCLVPLLVVGGPDLPNCRL